MIQGSLTTFFCSPSTVWQEQREHKEDGKEREKREERGRKNETLTQNADERRVQEKKLREHTKHCEITSLIGIINKININGETKTETPLRTGLSRSTGWLRPVVRFTMMTWSEPSAAAAAAAAKRGSSTLWDYYSLWKGRRWCGIIIHCEKVEGALFLFLFLCFFYYWTILIIIIIKLPFLSLYLDNQIKY